MQSYADSGEDDEGAAKILETDIEDVDFWSG
jgi:hypothetical protein